MGSGWEHYEPGGLDPDYEPGPEYIESARWRRRFEHLFPHDERHFDAAAERFTDPQIERAARWDDLADPLAEMFRAVLFLRGWRARQRIIPWPALALLLRWLLRGLATEPTPEAASPLGTDRRPAADLTPPVALLRARSMLFACAPPARVRPAGMTG